MKFTIPGPPVPKARPRRGKYGNWYTPAKTVEYERHVGWCAATVRGPGLQTPFGTRPVIMYCDMYFPDKRIRDSDNVIKSIQDGCEKVLWDNDRNVVGRPRIIVRGDPNPRVEVEIKEKEQ